MKWLIYLLLMILAGVSTAQAQSNPTGKTLASTMEVYVFPKAGQTADQQSQDEVTCYEWATAKVGTDPFELSKQAAQQKAETEQEKAKAQEAGKGAGARGAVRGAAAGAVVGEIASDDPGKGAAYGAAAGAVAGRRKARRARHQATQQAEQQGQAKQEAIQKQMDNFKKAFGVCLEAKDYLVKF